MFVGQSSAPLPVEGVLATTADDDMGGAEIGLGRVVQSDPFVTRPAMEPAYFENPAHRLDVINGIANGNLPLKYAYAGSAAGTHDRLARSTGYRQVTGSATLEVEALGRVLPYPELPSALVEIGPGNGAHTVALLSDLLARGAPVRRYLGLDFSDTLLGLCRQRIADWPTPFPTVGTGVWDVESAPSSLIDEWRDHGEAIVVGLFGQTIGNVEDPPSTLTNIYASLSPRDILVLSVALRRSGAAEDEILAPYRTAVFRDALLEPLRAAGIAARDTQLRLSFRDATVVADIELNVPVLMEGHALAAGHCIRCFRSRRFEQREVPSLLDQNYWSLRDVVIDDDSEHAVVVGVRKSGVE